MCVCVYLVCVLQVMTQTSHTRSSIKPNDHLWWHWHWCIMRFKLFVWKCALGIQRCVCVLVPILLIWAIFYILYRPERVKTNSVCSFNIIIYILLFSKSNFKYLRKLLLTYGILISQVLPVKNILKKDQPNINRQLFLLIVETFDLRMCSKNIII